MNTSTYADILAELLKPEVKIYQEYTGNRYKIVNTALDKTIPISLGDKKLTYDNANYKQLNYLFRQLPNNSNTTLQNWILQNNKQEPANFEFVAWDNRKKFVKNGVNTINEWQNPEDIYGKDPNQQMPDIYKFFFQTIIPEPDCLEWLLDWIAKSLYSKTLAYLCLIGEEGVGKNTLAQIIGTLHLPSQYVVVEDETFNDKQNDYMLNKTFICFNEIKLSNKKDDSKLKSLVDETVNIRQKYMDTRYVTNNANIMIVSNYDDAFKVTYKSRRYGIMDLTEIQMVNWTIPHEFGSTLQEFQNNLRNAENLALLYRALRNRKIISNVDQSFKGKKYREMADSSRPAWLDRILDKIRNKTSRVLISQELLNDVFGEYDKTKPKVNTVKSAFKEYLSDEWLCISDRSHNVYVEKKTAAKVDSKSFDGVII